MVIENQVLKLRFILSLMVTYNRSSMGPMSIMFWHWLLTTFWLKNARSNIFIFFLSLEYFQGQNIGSGNGWIELVIVEARDLVAADLRGTSDPYVKVQYGDLKKRTKVRTPYS